MMLALGDSFQHRSDATALLSTGVLVLIAWADVPTHWQETSASPPDQHSVELTLQSEPEPESAPAPPPPVHVKTRQTLSRTVAASAPAAPMPAVDPPPPVPEGAAVVPVASEAPAMAASSPAHPDIDARYAATLRADIDARTRPPDSLQYRLRHPSGEARVRFLLSRTGEIRSANLSSTSGSPILDEAAVKIVASGRYPPMPADAFVGEIQHMFTVTIEFRPDSTRR